MNMVAAPEIGPTGRMREETSVAHPISARGARRLAIGLIGALLVMLTGALPTSARASDEPAVVVDDDGTVHIPALTVPVSSFLTEKGKAQLNEYLHQVQDPHSRALPDDGVPFFMRPYLVSARAQFAVERQDIEIAGVKGYSYVPRGGIKPGNERRILINLHGGGFGGCYPGCAELESMPIAALGGIKVITIAYRQAPEAHFPAASEDVAAVYRELLKTYKPANIGIYGCSAGGMLVGMSMAWFDKEGLPLPGAIGIFCAGMTLESGPGFGGDSGYTAMPLGEATMPANSAIAQNLPPIEYLRGVDPKDPLAAPANSPELLAKFPPTLFITATRAFDFSSAVYSHGQLIKAGADAELHVWDGLFHGFFYNPDFPESRDVYDLIVRFFDKHLQQ